MHSVIFCTSEQQNVFHCAVWNTDWTTAQNRCMSIWYTNYSSRLDKRSQCTLVPKVLMDDDCNHKDDYSDRQNCALGARCVRYLMRKRTVYVRTRCTDHYNRHVQRGVWWVLEHLPLFPLMPKVPFCQGNYYFYIFIIKRPFVMACSI